MTVDVRAKLIEVLSSRLGERLDHLDAGDGRMTAHAALRTTQWVLESFGSKEIPPALEHPGTIEKLVAAFRDVERRWLTDDDVDTDWPPEVAEYVTLIESVLGIDLDTLPQRRWQPALARFGAPSNDLLVAGISARTDFGYNDPSTWLIQHRIGGPTDDGTLDLEIDRFIAHWDYRRSHPNPWHEVNRGQALSHLVYVQRNSLLWSERGWAPSQGEAEGNAHNFLYCFPEAVRYFTNSASKHSYSFGITKFTLDTGIIAVSDDLAGIWWHAEDD